MNEAVEVPLRVLIKQSELQGVWVAVCIDRYLVAQGKSPLEACESLKACVRAAVEHGVQIGFKEHPLEHLPEAPARYLADFEAGTTPPPPRTPVTRSKVRTDFEPRLAVAG